MLVRKTEVLPDLICVGSSGTEIAKYHKLHK